MDDFQKKEWVSEDDVKTRGMTRRTSDLDDKSGRADSGNSFGHEVGQRDEKYGVARIEHTEDWQGHLLSHSNFTRRFSTKTPKGNTWRLNKETCGLFNFHAHHLYPWVYYMHIAFYTDSTLMGVLAAIVNVEVKLMGLEV